MSPVGKYNCRQPISATLLFLISFGQLFFVLEGFFKGYINLGNTSDLDYLKRSALYIIIPPFVGMFFYKLGVMIDDVERDYRLPDEPPKIWEESDRETLKYLSKLKKEKDSM